MSLMGKFDWADPFLLDDQLTDDERMIRDTARAYAEDRLAPRIVEAFAKEHPEVVRALEKLAGKITEEQMSEMNYQVNVEGKNPAEVARTFLIDEGLIKEGQE